MNNVYINARGLVSHLGWGLPAACHRLSESMPPNISGSTDNAAAPFYAIPDPTDASANNGNWLERAQSIVLAAMHEADCLTKTQATLISASSSTDIGWYEGADDIPQSMHDFPERIRSWLNWQGPILLISAACTASLQACIHAMRLIQNKLLDEVVILGIELSNQLSQTGFANMQLLSKSTAQPLGVKRDGLLLGEAVAVLHLSKYPARWQLLSGRSCINGNDMTGASQQTIEQVCQDVLSDAHISYADLSLVKLQASGSPTNDLVEIQALQNLAHASQNTPALTSLKSILGHTLGASGAAELALLTCAIESDCYFTPQYPLIDTAAHTAWRPHTPVQYLMAIILGFSGEHAAVILKDTDYRKPTDAPD